MRWISPGLLSVLALAGCTYGGGDMGDPVTRKFHWFSYVAGDDIRANCQTGTPDRFRLVYNGIYDQQLRLYELDSVRRLLTVKVTAPGNAAQVSGDDLLAPWRAVEGKVPLDEAAYTALVGDFTDPETDLNALAFAAPLFAADPTGVAVARPGPIPVDPQYETSLRHGEVVSFSLKVGANGMVR
ncbi:MAG: hypothetical protein FD176_1836 [Rhodospirillaceae bacterium]|nr:MAG: hypothetical protein FD176_1836 [Rhodospirillaceae bacterium]